MANPSTATSDRQNALRRLLGAFRAELTPEGARAYVSALDDLNDAKLVAGIALAIKECATFPTVAILREKCREAQPVEPTVKFLPAPKDDESDPRNWHRCPACQDSGWIQRPGPHPLIKGETLDFAHRCACAMTNPAVLAGVGVGVR